MTAEARLMVVVRVIMVYSVHRQLAMTVNKRRRKRQIDTLENREEMSIGISPIFSSLML